VQKSTSGFIELYSGLTNSSQLVSKQTWTAIVRQGGSAHWLVVLDMLPCGLRLLDRGWYLCIRFTRPNMKLFDWVWA